MVQVSTTRRSSISKITSQRALSGTVQGTAFVSSELTLGSAIAEPYQVFGGSMAAEKPGSGASPALGTASFVNVLQHNPKEVSKLMKKAMFSLLAVFALAALASAQLTGVGRRQRDGRHLGRSPRLRPRLRHVPCTAQRRGWQQHRDQDTQSGDFALWGQDLTPLYGQTLNFGDGRNLSGHSASTGHHHQRA